MPVYFPKNKTKSLPYYLLPISVFSAKNDRIKNQKNETSTESVT